MAAGGVFIPRMGNAMEFAFGWRDGDSREFLGGIAKRPRFLRAWPFVASYEFWGLGFAYRASSSSRHTATSFISSRTPQMSSRAFFMKVPPLLLSMQQRFRYLLMQEEEWGHIQRRCR